MLHKGLRAAHQGNQIGKAQQAIQVQGAVALAPTSHLPATQQAPQSSDRPPRQGHMVVTVAAAAPSASIEPLVAPAKPSHDVANTCEQAEASCSPSQSAATTHCITVSPASFPWSWDASSNGPQHGRASVVIDLTEGHASAADEGQPQLRDSFNVSHIQHDGLLLRLGANAPSPTYQQDIQALHLAAQHIQQGQPVAIPTETVYGLAADALNADAVKSIYAAKRRPADNPLIVHISSLDMLYSLYPAGWSLPDVYREVVAAHWPGPLTILLPAPKKIPSEVVCGQPTVAVRMPDHPVARALIALSGRPLAAPSANSSGRPSPTTAQHVMEDMAGRIPLVLDGGHCECGVESTVLDGLRQPPAILRPGGVTVEQLSRFASMQGLQVYRKHFVDKQLEESPTTPGMKYRHYSPHAPITLIDLHACQEDVGHLRSAAQQEVLLLVQQAVQDALDKAYSQQPENAIVLRVGVLRTSKGAHCSPGATHGNQANEYGVLPGQLSSNGCNGSASHITVVVAEYVLGDLEAPGDVARQLFKALRSMDDLGVSHIIAEGVQEAGEGLAVMNRLRKAATRVVQL